MTEGSAAPFKVGRGKVGQLRPAARPTTPFYWGVGGGAGQVRRPVSEVGQNGAGSVLKTRRVDR